jgi:2-polyprenyl-6-methoxyphenol hydroxylase-like FAD-dependent oxidoreductase
MTWATASDAYPIPDIRRRLAEVAHLVAQATRAMSRSSTRRRPKPRRYRAHREAFIGDAAMAREMLRF